MGKIYLNIICDNSCNNYSELFMSYNHGKCQYSDSKKNWHNRRGSLTLFETRLDTISIIRFNFF